MKRFVLALLLLTVGCADKNVSPATSATPMSAEVSQSPADPLPVLSADLQPDIQLDRAVYAPGEEMKVTAIAVNLSETAWVWIVPADKKPEIVAKPEKSLEIFATFPAARDELTTVAPVAAGSYAVCLYASASTGPELCRRNFEVKLTTATASDNSPLLEGQGPSDPFSATPHP